MRRTRRSRPLARGLSAAAVALACAAAAPTAAHAGTYSIRSCDNGSTDGWTFYGEGTGTIQSNTCGAPGGRLAGSISTPPNALARWTFAAPADTEIDAFTIGRSYGLNPGQAYGTPTYHAHTAGPGGMGWVSELANFAPVFVASGHGYESAANLTGQDHLYTWVYCGGGGGCTGPASVEIDEGWINLRDAFSPSITSTSGSLLAGGALKGTKHLSYAATDRGGGLYRAQLMVDGAAKVDHVIDANGGACAQSAGGTFNRTVPCKLSASDTLALDTTTIPEGEHTVSLVVRDVTGTNTATHGPVTILVDNIPAPRSTTAPVMSGSTVHGQALWADVGGWDGGGVPMSFAYRWQRLEAGLWVDIAGATGARYVPAADDIGHRLRVRVTAASSEGATEAFSDPSAVVRAAEAPAEAPAAGVKPTTPGSGGGNAGGTTGGETLNGRGATPAAAMSAQFVSSRSRTLKARYGSVVTITGTLRRPDGVPIVGAQLDVTSQDATFGAATVGLGHVATDEQGVFRFRLPNGPSRTVRFGYKALLEATAYSQTTEVVVSMIPSVSLKTNRKALRNGQAVRFSGKVAGAPKGVRKVVEMQAMDGRRWRTFATVRLSRSGTFSHRYRFTRTFHATTYRFRALVKSEQGWPFLSGSSKSKPVKVRP